MKVFCANAPNSGNLGVLGGTFDPIHVGHVAMARQAQREFSLESVIVLVAANPPHKRAAAGIEDRLVMAALALDGEDGIELSSLEAERSGQTYTVDSLRTLAQLYPEKRLHYIIGADTLLELPSWRSANEVADLCEFIVFYRVGAQLHRAKAVLDKLPGLKLHFAELNVPDVSSTEIRARAKSGASLRTLVCPSVEAYIKRRRLYR